MQRATLDLVVGAFVLAGMAALVFLAMKVGNLSFAGTGESYELRADFENIGGLKPRAPVKSAGVVVGRVAAIGYDTENYQAVVSLRIENRYKFTKDTFAKIYTSGLLGEQYVGLEPGGDPDMLKPGDKILKTQSAVVLENLISQFLYNKAQDDPGK